MIPRARIGLPLLAVVSLLALGAGVLVWLQEPEPGRLRLADRVPEFRLKDLAGTQVTLSELRGQVVIVNFWGTWCAPCRDEAPALERLYSNLHEDGFELLALSIDETGAGRAVEEFSKEFGWSFPVLLDPERQIYQAFGATGVPETFLIDAQGRLVERFVGPRDWDHPRYAQAVRRLLASPAPGGPAEGAN